MMTELIIALLAHMPENRIVQGGLVMEWRTKIKQLPRTQYCQEFREQSVKFFKESGLTLVEAAKRLSLPKGTLKKLGLC